METTELKLINNTIPTDEELSKCRTMLIYTLTMMTIQYADDCEKFYYYKDLLEKLMNERL